MTIAYLAHPVGESGSLDELLTHSNNIASAHEWIAFLAVVAPLLTVECSWIAHNTALSSTWYGGHRVRSAHELLRVCAVLVLVGGWVSPHMRQLADWARAADLPVLDLTDLGEIAPELTAENRRAVAGRLAEAGIQ